MCGGAGTVVGELVGELLAVGARVDELVGVHARERVAHQVSHVVHP